jgi:hypothetical protein
VIENSAARTAGIASSSQARTYAKGKPAPAGARNRSARPIEK